MAEFIVGLSRLRLPPFTRVRQDFPSPRVADVAQAVREALDAPPIAARLRPGLLACVAVGSRGIAQLALIVATLVAELRARGMEVVIIPAMGSHGGATAGGQQDVLARLGVDVTSVGASVHSAMETTVVGALRYDATAARYVAVAPGAAPGGDTDTDADTVEVHLDRTASQADLVIPVVRVKPHTGFRGRYESGICKMLCIGLGKHAGCSRLHREGYGRFPALIPAAAATVLATGRIACALAVIENANESLAHIEAVDSTDILTREPELLEQARALMPRLLLPRIDVLVIEEFGKDISGVGMDPNITGRGVAQGPGSSLAVGSGPGAGHAPPDIRRIVVLGLTPGSHGNATGLGMADLITERAFAAIDRQATAINVLTSGSLAGGRIPVAVHGDDQAILAAASCVPGVKPEQAGIVRIRSTLHLTSIAVSPSLLPVVAGLQGCTIEGPFTGSWT